MNNIWLLNCLLKPPERFMLLKLYFIVLKLYMIVWVQKFPLNYILIFTIPEFILNDEPQAIAYIFFSLFFPCVSVCMFFCVFTGVQSHVQRHAGNTSQCQVSWSVTSHYLKCSLLNLEITYPARLAVSLLQGPAHLCFLFCSWILRILSSNFQLCSNPLTYKTFPQFLFFILLITLFLINVWPFFFNLFNHLDFT